MIRTLGHNLWLISSTITVKVNTLGHFYRIDRAGHKIAELRDNDVIEDFKKRPEMTLMTPDDRLTPVEVLSEGSRKIWQNNFFWKFTTSINPERKNECHRNMATYVSEAMSLRSR